MDLNLRDAVFSLGLDYPVTNGSVYTICPVCGDSRRPREKKMNVDYSANVFRCAKCGTAGGVLDFWALHRGINESSKSETRKAASRDIHNYLGDGSNSSEIKRKREEFSKNYNELPQELESLSNIELHKVYSAMLELPEFKLTEKHLSHLKEARCLTEGQVMALHYKSMPKLYNSYIVAKKLIDKGYNLKGVPGFFIDTELDIAKKLAKQGVSKENLKKIFPYEKGDLPWAFNVSMTGILLPIRSFEKDIIGFQIRTDSGAPKYICLSSRYKECGCKASTFVHHTGNFKDFPSTIFLTEGPLKGDIASLLSGRPFLAIQGVNNLKILPDVLITLKNNGAKTIINCLDMDRYSNPRVMEACQNIEKIVLDAGLKHKTIRWDDHYKGIDDYLINKFYKKDE